MTVNLRKISHSHSYNYPSGFNYYTVYKHFNLSSCGLGHTDCQASNLSTDSIAVDSSSTSTDTNTKPRNLRKKFHSHLGLIATLSYTKTDFNPMVSGGRECSAGHSKCDSPGSSGHTAGIKSATWGVGSQEVQSSIEGINNLRAKNKHNHSLPNISHSSTNFDFLVLHDCPSGHANCQAGSGQRPAYKDFSLVGGNVNNSWG